jgi:hypothetical protein
MTFWMWSYHELVGDSGGYTAGYLVLLSQGIHLLIMSDFLYHYVSALYAGTPLELPIHQDTVFDRML